MTPRIGWPRSLFGRHVLLIICLILCAECGVVTAYYVFVQKPRIERMSEVTLRYLNLLSGAVAHMSVAERQRFLADLGRQNASAWVSQGQPEGLVTPPTLLMRWALERLQARLGPDVRLGWSAGPPSLLWVRTDLGGESWWLGLEAGGLAAERSRLVLGVMVGAGVLAILGATLIQRHLHRPLALLQQAAERLAAGEYPVIHIAVAPTEIAGLAMAFNGMVRQLEANEKERALMLAGLSHDLRTPLAKLRLAAEILEVEGEDELLQGMVRNIGVAEQIIEQFVDFARLGAEEPRVPCDVDELVGDVAASLATPRLIVERPEGTLPTLICRPLALRRAVVNLVENALKYSDATVWMSVGTGVGTLLITVRDQGPGIPEEALSAMRQPFARLDQARGGPGGAGLGLAIVERVMALEGGRLELINRDGLEARLVLPMESVT